jgi:hypothetical protein
MGMFWQYFSFEPKKWKALFDGSAPRAKKYFVTGTWDSLDPNLPDPEEQTEEFLNFVWKTAPRDIVQIAEHLARNGPTYRGLTGPQSKILDSMFTGIFSPEGAEPLLRFTHEHQAGLAQRAVVELLSRAEPARVGGILGVGGRVSIGQPVLLARFLSTGRRCGSDEPPSPEDMYFVFEPAEIPQVLNEVGGLLAVDRPWKTAEFEQSVREELLPALRRAAEARRYLAGRYT